MVGPREAWAAVSDYPLPEGLEYVAAAYEQLGAQADADTSPTGEPLHAYADAAHGEAFWAYEAYRRAARMAGVPD